MKKLLSIALILLLALPLLVMVGCQTTGDNTTSDNPSANTSGNNNSNTIPDDVDEIPDDAGEITEEMLRNSKPNEYIPEKIAAGMEVIIGFSINNSEGTGKVVEARLLEEFPKMGLTLVVAIDSYDMALQISNIENFATMGCALVLIHTTDVSLLEDVITQAEATGTYCVLYGDTPKFQMGGYTTIDLAALGYGAGLLARVWIDEAYPNAGPGEIKAAVHGNYKTTPGTILADNIRLALNDDPRCDIVYIDEDLSGIDNGFRFAEQAYTTDPDVRLFVGFNLQATYGINNFIMSLPNINPNEYAAIGTTYDVSVPDFLEATAKGEGIFRGTTAGSTDQAWGHLECINALLFNHEEPMVDRIQPVLAFSNGLDITDAMNQYYYGVYTE